MGKFYCKKKKNDPWQRFTETYLLHSSTLHSVIRSDDCMYYQNCHYGLLERGVVKWEHSSNCNPTASQLSLHTLRPKQFCPLKISDKPQRAKESITDGGTTGTHPVRCELCETMLYWNYCMSYSVSGKKKTYRVSLDVPHNKEVQKYQEKGFKN